MSEFPNDKSIKYSTDSERSLQRDAENEIEQKAESYLESSQTNLSFNCQYSNDKDTDSNSAYCDSIFDDPIIAQHIHIDFTPDETVDNEIVQKKVYAFWDFVDAHPELQACIVKPEKDITVSKSGSIIATASKASPKPAKNPVVPSALSTLSLFEKKGITDAALEFEAETYPTTPSTNNNDFKLNKSDSPTFLEDPLKFQTERVTDHQKKPSKVKLPNIQFPKPEGAKELCENLLEWDKHHPQSFDPPGMTPTII